MKDKIPEILIIIALMALCLLLSWYAPIKVLAADKHQQEPVPMYTTAYYYGEITASGAKVRTGICAVKKEWIGLTAIVYQDDNGKPGELIGIFECLDTGFGADSDGDGIGSIQEGKLIDIYQPDYESCVEWMELTGGRCFVQMVDANG